MHSPAPPPPVGIRLPGVAGPESYRVGPRSARIVAPVTSPVAARPVVPPVSARWAVGPLGNVHVASAPLYGMAGRPLTDWTGETLGEIGVGVTVRLFTPNGRMVQARIPTPTGDPRLAARIMWPGDFPFAGSRVFASIISPAARRGETAQLLARWQGWLGREAVRHVLDRVAYVADPRQPLALRVEYDTRTGKPKMAHAPDHNNGGGPTGSAERASVVVRIDLAANIPTVQSIDGKIPAAFDAFFAALVNRPLTFPTAAALRNMGITNALMALNLRIEPPLTQGAALLQGKAQPSLAVSVAPDQALLTGFAWTFPDGRRRVSGAPWIGTSYAIRHIVVTTPGGALIRVPLPLELQPFWGTIDPRALGILAAEYFARQRPRHHGYGAEDDVQVRVFDDGTSVLAG